MVEPPTDGEDVFRPFAALVRPGDGRNVTITSLEGRWMPELLEGDVVLLSPVDTDGEGLVPAATVAGLVDDAGHSVALQLDRPAQRRDGRTEIRYAAAGAVTVETDTGSSPADLEDVSLGGARLRLGGGVVPPTGTCTLRLVDAPGVGPIPCSVAWARDGQLGVEFGDHRRLDVVRLIRSVAVDRGAG